MEVDYKGICNPKPKTLLLKATSRQRPEILLKTVSEYVRLASNTKDIVWLFSFDEDDSTCNNYDFNKRLFAILPDRDLPNVCIYNKNSTSKINAINRDLDTFELDWQVLICASDDQIPIAKGWDDIIRNAMPDHLDSSLWFWDGVQPRISTMEIVGRVYYERFGYIYNPIYHSFFCDNESTIVAQKLGKQIKSDQCIIKHEHYAANGVVKFDALYERNNKEWAHDEKIFHEREKINFGL